MGTLILFNLALIAVITAMLVLIKKIAKSTSQQSLIFLIAPVITVAVHYSTFIYRCFTGGDFYFYLGENINLLLPIYPCNLVMWCALIYGLIPNKNTKLALVISDYVFWFGIASTLVGMFANVDFIMNPTLSDYEVTKSIVAHATLLFNLLLIPVFGRLRPSFFRNMFSITSSVAVMFLVGLYCNALLSVLVSPQVAYEINSMFIIHSPFEAVPFLRYPLIAAVALVIYFIIFTVCDIITTPRGSRWYNRIRSMFSFRKK